MKKKELRKALEDLEMTQVALSRLFDVDERTARKWANAERPVPQLAAILLRGLLSGKISVDDVRSWKC